jgi:hypothetical protein
MTNLRAIIIYASFLILIGVGICRDLIQRVIDEGLFNKRPPNDGFKTKYQQRVKNKRVNLRLLKATVALTCLPTFVFGGRESLSSDLNAYVDKVGYLQTGRLTESLKNRVKSDLATYPRNEGISTLKLAVVDTGASAICMKSKTSMIPGSYEELSKPIALGGISSGLEIIGKGKAAFELISSRGKKIRVVRYAFCAPGLPVDLVPPQRLMRTSEDGWFKINGEGAGLEFKDGEKVNVPYDPLTSLPMIYYFNDIDAAVIKLETSLHSCVTNETDQNLSRACKEMLR